MAGLTRSNKALVRAAKALVDRWHSPLWKNTRHTADYIKALSDAIGSAENITEQTSK